VLPLGDFSHIKDLPAMFRQCKATEDRDLNAIEFLVEHVSGMGQLIEETEHEFEAEEEDGDKPHAPVQFHFEQQQQIICFYHCIKVPAIKPLPALPLNTVPTHRVYISDYISNIFRPPIS
ncbi:MAG TPA: hypothetical protein VK154_00700, partial [Chitinophagales bacterium]|nr:hypothetical protein [Chitinophagales bacterium]